MSYFDTIDDDDNNNGLPEGYTFDLNSGEAESLVQHVLHSLAQIEPEHHHIDPDELHKQAVAEKEKQSLEDLGMNTTLIIADDRLMLHRSDQPHPECPERIGAIRDKIASLPPEILDHCVVRPCENARLEDIALVHGSELIEFVQSLTGNQARMDNKDFLKRKSLFVNEESVNCALLACGGVVEATKAVMNGKCKNALAVVRPPGHHAEPDECMGFCFFNNVAVAAQVAKRHGAKRILIVDWDVHFGNGTQLAFDDDPDVLYFSTHRYHDGLFYPGGTGGRAENVGQGLGRGFTVNVGWSEKGRGDLDYLAAWQQVLLPIAYEFDPDFVIVSAGFDAARGDPLGQCKITPEGYAHLLFPLLGFGDGKIVVALEGGYNLTSISSSIAECLMVMTGKLPPRLPRQSKATESALNDIERTAMAHAPYWEVLKIHR